MVKCAYTVGLPNLPEKKIKAVIDGRTETIMYINNDTLQPDKLDEILALRPEGATEAPKAVDHLESRMKGALIGRFAGCMLGIPVEMYSVADMQAIALENGMAFPPVNYWTGTDNPTKIHYRVNKRTDYLLQNIDKVAVDDDITYVILNLLLLEKYGKNYTLDDIAQIWKDILPYACTAEEEALAQLQAGTKPEWAANFNNYVEWIGAAIRADAFGYAAPGDPETAAKMSYNDAFLTHRKNGIYGEMFVAAMIACAAVTDNMEDIIRGGLAQIPATSRLYDKIDRVIKDYNNGVTREEAYARVKEEYNIKDSDSWLHTISNAAIVAIGLLYGENDFGKSICAAVEVGYDTDCNGATVGSVMGMRNGTAGIGEEWTKPVNGKLETTIFGISEISIDEAAEKTMKHLPAKQ